MSKKCTERRTLLPIKLGQQYCKGSLKLQPKRMAPNAQDENGSATSHSIIQISEAAATTVLTTMAHKKIDIGCKQTSNDGGNARNCQTRQEKPSRISSPDQFPSFKTHCWQRSSMEEGQMQRCKAKGSRPEAKDFRKLAFFFSSFRSGMRYASTTLLTF